MSRTVLLDCLCGRSSRLIGYGPTKWEGSCRYQNCLRDTGDAEDFGLLPQPLLRFRPPVKGLPRKISILGDNPLGLTDAQLDNPLRAAGGRGERVNQAPPHGRSLT